jgi:hypothetical protein
VTERNDSPAIPESDWKWHGVSAHFICGQWCRFHLATQIGKVLVSTVGEYVHPRHSGGGEQAERKWLRANWPGEDIGYNRKYETMVFRLTGEICERQGCGCGLPDIASGEIDAAPYNERGQATDGHMRLCHKWATQQNALLAGLANGEEAQ